MRCEQGESVTAGSLYDLLAICEVKAYDSPSIQKSNEKRLIMKHIFPWIIIGLCLSLAGCGGRGVNPASSFSTPTTTTNSNSTGNNNSSSTTNSSTSTTTSGTTSSTNTTNTTNSSTTNNGSSGTNNSGTNSGGNGNNNNGSDGTGSNNGLPTPPAGATVFSKLQNGTDWHSCNDPACAGGGAKGTYWMAQNQSSPSRDGSSMEFFTSGVYTNALFWQYLGPTDDVTNFLWDFYFYLDDNAQGATQALEFDAFQFVNGYNYMMGSECDYAGGHWDSWDGASNKWIHTSVPCKKFSSNTWHHIQWYITADHKKHQYTYITLVIDGNPNPLNLTRNAKDFGWPDNLGVQWQLDVNASGGGYHEWVDEATLTVW